MNAHGLDQNSFAAPGSLKRRALLWLVVSVFAALLVYFSFRGYLSPELLFHFASSLYC